MGTPRKLRSKYDPPSHPWQRERIEQEKELNRTYHFKNKKEIWKMVSVLKDVTSQAKKLNGSMGEQADKETKLLLDRLLCLGLLKENPTLDAVLDLKLENILDRRLQSMVFKQGLARTMKQARQFITHSHIAVKGTPITQPSHLVTIDEEKALTFVPRSALSDPEHPERSLKPQEQPKPAEVKTEGKAEETKTAEAST